MRGTHERRNVHTVTIVRYLSVDHCATFVLPPAVGFMNRLLQERQFQRNTGLRSATPSARAPGRNIWALWVLFAGPPAGKYFLYYLHAFIVYGAIQIVPRKSCQG
jgi:hypothetical protein